MKLEFNCKFRMKGVGGCRLVIGITIERKRKRRTIKMSQTRYEKKIIELFEITEAKGQ